MVVVADNDFQDSFIGNDDNQLVAMNTFRWLAIPIYGDIPWLSESPEYGSVPGHSSLATTLTFDASELTPGEYDGFLSIEHNDPYHDEPVIIPIQLNVTDEVPPESASISGPEVGLVGKSQEFIAAVVPDLTTVPLTYVWEAEGQAPITHTNGLTDTISLTWDMEGMQLITVTVSNQAGTVSATYQVTIILNYTSYMPLAQKAPGGLNNALQSGNDGLISNPAMFPQPNTRKR
jgi:hypothetical protein